MKLLATLLVLLTVAAASSPVASSHGYPLEHEHVSDPSGRLGFHWVTKCIYVRPVVVHHHVYFPGLVVCYKVPTGHWWDESQPLEQQILEKDDLRVEMTISGWWLLLFLISLTLALIVAVSCCCGIQMMRRTTKIRKYQVV